MGANEADYVGDDEVRLERELQRAERLMCFSQSGSPQEENEGESPPRAQRWVVAEGGERRKRKKEEQIERLESVEWSLRRWWMFDDFLGFNFPSVEGHN